MTFSPIAIVGQGCVLPGALTPEALWEHVVGGRDLTGPCPEGYWGLDARRLHVAPEEWEPGKYWSDRGGYVRGFEQAFDARDFALDADFIAALDVQFQWALYAARQALPRGGTGKAGVILGNLGYPTTSLSELADSVWAPGLATAGRPHPRNRFLTGSLAPLVAKALGLSGPSFALDASCASSLYAIKLACDRLHSGEADLMLSGAVNRTDGLLIHTGFCALSALSRTGRSRPFHRDADGLVPAEGAVVLALKRLGDAEDAGETVLGVIRGIGLSNDGRDGGLLSPSSAGQVEAMRRAYRQAGLSPTDVGLVECHATGTPVGDGVELRSLREVFVGSQDVPLGSLKSNLGHLITAAGAAALVKVLAALREGVRPATLGAFPFRAELEGGPLRVVTVAEPWRGPRCAAVSAFGFGGNNAHLIVEAWRPHSASRAVVPAPPPREPVAIIGLAVLAGNCRDTRDFADLVRGAATGAITPRMDEIILEGRGLGFPPRDLACALPQQLAVLRVALEAVEGLSLPHESTSVLVGTQCDPETVRFASRLRWGAAGPDIDAAGVVGAMPNVPANRLNVQLDLCGPSFTVFADELSGPSALEVAVAGLRSGELGAALVCAVDLCCEPVHESAAEVLPPRRRQSGDAAVALVLQRLADARRDGNQVFAIFDDGDRVEGAIAEPTGEDTELPPCLGHAHAASGLLHVAAGILRLEPGSTSTVRVSSLGDREMTVGLRAPGQLPPLPARREPSFPLRFPAHWPAVEPPAARLQRGHTALMDAARVAVHAGRVGLEDHLHHFSASEERFHSCRATLLKQMSERLPRGKTSTDQTGPRGPAFSRRQCEQLAGGKVSEVFGPLFVCQDGFRRQVRLPRPPLLLVDRITGLDAEPGVRSAGTIWTETDVGADSWYLHEGAMSAGVMIESGQADLTLISWMGIDFENRGERVYRLLGCDLTYHGPLARVGDTLCYDIHIDGHARNGDVRLFFFHYTCRVDGRLRMTVRNGQAGFFTDEELARSAGVLWSPEGAEFDAGARLDPPAVEPTRAGFTARQMSEWYEGRPAACFGPGYERLLSHTCSPRGGNPALRLLGEVTHCEARGGPWGRGYLRARTTIRPGDWYFDGHFLNDPCMPGTLMFEGCVQALSFYLGWLGHTLDHDGWRFEPAQGETFALRCRGQVVPTSREVVYEVFVEEVHGDPEPRLFADVLVNVDGLKAFHCRRLAVALVPDWPLSRLPEESAAARAVLDPVATLDDVRGDPYALLACAWGKPSDAFGSMYSAFDGVRRAPRLPGPPYHFITRLTVIEADRAVPRVGSVVEADYEVPSVAWYLEEGGGTMPFAVLLEVNLQPCGWLATLMGFTLRAPEDLYFRNLDGTGEAARPVRGGETLHTRVVLTNVFQLGSMVIVAFQTRCTSAGETVAHFTTSFGFFTRSALASQVGLPVTEAERAVANLPSPFRLDLTRLPEKYFTGPLRLPAGRLRMLDRVTGYWPEAGAAGLGRLRAEQDVDPAAWYFAAHFYQDPVQPGSLGVEAMIQLLQFYTIEGRLADGLVRPRFEPIASGRVVTWKYRGQVVPTSGVVRVEVEVTEVGRDDWGAFVLADAWLWVDGLPIYHVTGLGAKIFSEGQRSEWSALPISAALEETLDPEVDTWLKDHRPTYSVPVAPLTWMLDAIVRAVARRAPGAVVVQVEELSVTRWLTCPRRRQVRVNTKPIGGEDFDVVLLADLDSPDRDWTPVMTGRVRVAPAHAEAPTLARLIRLTPVPLPYASKSRFHGPAFQLLRAVELGEGGAMLTLDAAGGGLPLGLVHPALIDGLWHVLTRQVAAVWFPGLPADHDAVPCRIDYLNFFGPAPRAGLVTAQVRPAGYDLAGGLLSLDVEQAQEGRVWVRGRLVARLVPLGPFAAFPDQDIAAFLHHRRVRGLSISRHDAGASYLAPDQVRRLDWLPGTMAAAYRIAPEADDLARQILVKEYLARRWDVHPASVEVQAGDVGTCPELGVPATRVGVRLEGEELVVREA